MFWIKLPLEIKRSWTKYCVNDIMRSARNHIPMPALAGAYTRGLNMKPELVVALDVPSASHAVRMVEALHPIIKFFKVGLELFTSQGPSIVHLLRNLKCDVFLDLKLHDIPNTVAGAVRMAAEYDVTLLTVHAMGGRAMLKAAAEAAASYADRAPRLLAVTTLTSMAQSDLEDVGIKRTLTEQAIALAKLSMDCGIHGVVTSALEAQSLRQALGPSAILLTPGIRAAGDKSGDQKRVATPAMAVKAGANFLVVGRPILMAADPQAAAKAIQEEITDTYNPS